MVRGALGIARRETGEAVVDRRPAGEYSERVTRCVQTDTVKQRRVYYIDHMEYLRTHAKPDRLAVLRSTLERMKKKSGVRVKTDWIDQRLAEIAAQPPAIEEEPPEPISDQVHVDAVKIARHSAVYNDRKVPRKGTHSCRECKLRKVKCVFASPSATVCNMCKKRKARCISQWNDPDTGDTLQSTTDTSETPTEVSNARNMVIETARRRQRPLADDTESPKRRAISINSTPASTPRAISPDPPTVQNGPVPQPVIVAPTPPPSNVSPPGTSKLSPLMKELLRAIPSYLDITLLLEKMDGFPPMNYPFDYASYCSRSSKTAAMILDLRQPESNPFLLAKQMLALASAIRRIPRNDFIPGLSKHHYELMDELAETAIGKVTTNDALLGTLEGLELIILQALHHVDCGDAQRAWVSHRRAVTTAQLLGLHGSSHYRFKVINSNANLDPEAMWISIVCMEREASLLLGLPTSTGGVILKERTTGSEMAVSLGNVAGKILERNRIEVSQQASDLTKDIDQELVMIAEQMPPAFWQPLDFARVAQDPKEASNELRRAIDHGFYHNLVIQLHLPHMLCPPHDLYSKMACVNACREILSRHPDLQSFEPVVSRCRMIDFHAVVAGMALMLAHAISHCGKRSENVLAYQRASDRGMVERTLENMKLVSDLHQDTLLGKCTRLLMELLAIEEEAAHQHRHNVEQQQNESEPPGHIRKMLIARAPFLGVIQLSKEGIAAMTTSSTITESTSVGGIGAIQALETNPTSSTSNVPGQQENNTLNAAMDEFVLPGDYTIPGGAMNRDDWGFQGMNAAMFSNANWPSW